MLIATVVMGALAVTLLFVGYYRGEGEHESGFKAAMLMTVEILPLLLFAFIVAGMIKLLVPQELMSRWVGEESGLKGIFIGTLAGGLTFGGPYVSLPIAAGILRSGAGIGTVVAFLTGWSLWGISRLPMEVGILGWKISAIRLVTTFFFPPIAGLLAHLFFSGAK